MKSIMKLVGKLAHMLVAMAREGQPFSRAGKSKSIVLTTRSVQRPTRVTKFGSFAAFHKESTEYRDSCTLGLGPVPYVNRTPPWTDWTKECKGLDPLIWECESQGTCGEMHAVYDVLVHEARDCLYTCIGRDSQ